MVADEEGPAATEPPETFGCRGDLEALGEVDLDAWV